MSPRVSVALGCCNSTIMLFCQALGERKSIDVLATDNVQPRKDSHVVREEYRKDGDAKIFCILIFSQGWSLLEID